MREADRISATLAAIREAWEANPDLRLGQLVYNDAHTATHGAIPPCPELFYLDDDQLLAGLPRRAPQS
jgi:hypothetical protein